MLKYVDIQIQGKYHVSMGATGPLSTIMIDSSLFSKLLLQTLHLLRDKMSRCLPAVLQIQPSV